MTSLQHLKDPHANGGVYASGLTPEQAGGVLILLHGRGATGQGMLDLYDQLNLPGLAALAPQAAGQTWYPYSFLAPIAENQPYLDSALRRVETLVTDLISRGIAAERIALLGFSQGACLAVEFAARHPRAYGAVMGLTGGLIGPAGTPRKYAGSLQGVRVFLGAGDPDGHVPFERVEETRDVLQAMGAQVEMRRYPGMPHTINADELTACRALLNQMLTAGTTR